MYKNEKNNWVKLDPNDLKIAYCRALLNYKFKNPTKIIKVVKNEKR